MSPRASHSAEEGGASAKIRAHIDMRVLKKKKNDFGLIANLRCPKILRMLIYSQGPKW
jgi:hypothetical protein